MLRPRPMIIKSKYPSSKPRFRDYPQPRYWPSWIIIGVFRLFGFLPQWFIWYGGGLLGEIAFHLHRTTTIRTNIALCFPQLSNEEQDKLRRRYYHYLGRNFLGLGTAWHASRERLKKLVSVKGGEYLESARKDGRGVLFLAPHFLPLELGAMFIASDKGNVISFYRKPRNPLFHQAIRHYLSRFDCLVMERYENLKPLVKAMREGMQIYYLPDQDPDRPGDSFVFADFFGVPTATYTAFAKLATLGKANVIPVVTRMLPGSAGYELEYFPALENFPSGDDLIDAERINRFMEEVIREAPEQYLWSYRRFKTRPGGAPSPYERKK
jgi:KDO2-lipid IV(A) lauroyltransferase